MSAILQIGTLRELTTSMRHQIVLHNSATGVDHTLRMWDINRTNRFTHVAIAVLFSVPDAGKPSFSCMESECPHLGASLEKAPAQWSDHDIEDLVVVWYVGFKAHGC